MIYFCADDYGISANVNNRIERCIAEGALNKISVMPNGEIDNLENILSNPEVKIGLHLNLIEGKPLSNSLDIKLLLSKDGYFKHSFIGLFFLSLLPKRKELEKQLYTEIQSQIRFWTKTIGSETSISLDSHQHVHMIPLIFKTLLKVIRDEKVTVDYLRFPAEPLTVYLKTPSLYFKYPLSGIIKQWLIKFLAIFNRKYLKQTNIKQDLFMGIMFSGRMDAEKTKKLLTHYLKLAEKKNKDIEILFHPGYVKDGEKLIEGVREDFKKFYTSPLRKQEYEALKTLKLK